MKLGALTEIVLSMYHRGLIKSSTRELSSEIIQGYLRTAYGAVIKATQDAKDRSGDKDASYAISGAVKTEKVLLKKEGDKSYFDLSAFGVMRMDKGMDIVSFEQPPKYDSCLGGNVLTITQVSPYEVRFYLSDKTSYFFVRNDDGGVIYNLPDCLKELNISFVDGSSNADIPEDICLNICKIAFPDIFGVKKFNKVKIDDNSNDLEHELKQRIAAGA